jgi:pyridinium-3,5-bisthiocarboxylic acid mononucleotide nickel chelatase
MRIAYLECFSGISGDMLLGALLHAGVSEEPLRKAVGSLNIGAELRVSRVDRSGISSTKVDVLVNGTPADSYNERLAHHHHQHQPQEHGHGHHDGDRHHHVHGETGRAPSHSHGRSLSTIRDIIYKADIPEAGRQTAIRAFELLGEAEARLHNVPIETIHFHEVGAVDAIVDIVCAAVGCDALGVDEFICSPLNVGGGTITCAHGEFPVPAPAALALLKGVPVYSSGRKAELVTPTGAALVRALSCRFSDFPRMIVGSIGYGAGSRNPTGHANVLRLTVGNLIDHASDLNADCETIAVLETTIDDLSPQIMGYVSERLLAEGALDVFIIPAQMKKNRPGSLLTVLCRPEKAQHMREIIFSETSTLGIRTRTERRDCLQREIILVATQWGTVRVKESMFNGTITHYSPEYDDCRLIAEQRNVPLKQVQEETVRNYLAQRPSWCPQSKSQVT